MEERYEAGSGLASCIAALVVGPSRPPQCPQVTNIMQILCFLQLRLTEVLGILSL